VAKHAQAATVGQTPTTERPLRIHQTITSLTYSDEHTPDDIAGEISSVIRLPSNLVAKSNLHENASKKFKK
jgi:hypothetical protein